jgi:carbon monoxide dehydrogenase subunit G
MKLAGDYRFESKVDEVWDALFDPAVLAAVLPGCEKLELVDGIYLGEMKIKVGPVQGNFAGKVGLSNIDKLHSYTMDVDGRGAPGFVKAVANVHVEPDGDGTRVTYDADAQVGGKIASVGQRLLDTSARAIVRQSLDGLRDNIRLRADAYRAHHAADAEHVDTPVAKPAPHVDYKRVETSQLAKAVTKEVAKTFVLMPAMVVLLVALAGLAIYFVVR